MREKILINNKEKLSIIEKDCVLLYYKTKNLEYWEKRFKSKKFLTTNIEFFYKKEK